MDPKQLGPELRGGWCELGNPGFVPADRHGRHNLLRFHHRALAGPPGMEGKRSLCVLPLRTAFAYCQVATLCSIASFILSIPDANWALQVLTGNRKPDLEIF